MGATSLKTMAKFVFASKISNHKSCKLKVGKIQKSKLDFLGFAGFVSFGFFGFMPHCARLLLVLFGFASAFESAQMLPPPRAV